MSSALYYPTRAAFVVVRNYEKLAPLAPLHAPHPRPLPSHHFLFSDKPWQGMLSPGMPLLTVRARRKQL